MSVSFTRGHTKLIIWFCLGCLIYLLANTLIEQSTLRSALKLDALPSLDYITSALPGKRSLVPYKLKSLPLGSIKPGGWLEAQMQLMADGLAGHEHDFYEFVARSKWLGGDREYSALNEGFPYWFNGLVPLAYGLDNDRLKDQVHSAAQYVLDHQAHDGWLGPESGDDRLIWARFPLCLGFIQLAEANSTWTGPVVDALHRFSHLLNAMLRDDGVGYVMQKSGDWRFSIFTWGRVRNADMIITLQWLYEHYPADKTDILLENMKLLHEYGLKWENWYQEAAYFGRNYDKDLYTVPENETLPYFHYQHGVNVAQGLKSPAVVRRFTHNNLLLKVAKNGVDWTMLYHGAPSGTIIADERLVGLSAHSGSELCTSVELMYSLAYLYHATGDAYYGDRAELAAFNSLPAMFTQDYWAHQYVQTSNQGSAKKYAQSPFYNTNNWSQTFGLEPHYPCCTTNHPQGWPKFVSHSFAILGQNGIVHTLLSPGIVTTNLRSGSVTIRAETAYPFNDIIEYTVESQGAIDFYIRVPIWATEDSSITFAGSSISLRPAQSTRLHKLSLPQGISTITYKLQSLIRTETRANDTISVSKGALLYAVEIGFKRTSTLPRIFQHPDQHHPKGYAPEKCKDWIYSNATAWNIAIDPQTLLWHEPTFSHARDISNPIYVSNTNAGYITAQGCEINWPSIERGIPADPPVGDAKHCIGPSHEVKLIPYGSAKLHITEIPVIDLHHEG